MKYALEKITHALTSHLAIIFHSVCPFGDGEVSFFFFFFTRE